MMAAGMNVIAFFQKMDLPAMLMIVASLSVAFFILLIFRAGWMQRSDSFTHTEASKKEEETRR